MANDVVKEVPSWIGALHDTTTPILDEGSFEGSLFRTEEGISYYMLTKPLGPFPIGYIVGRVQCQASR